MPQARPELNTLALPDPTHEAAGASAISSEAGVVDAEFEDADGTPGL